MLLGLKSASVFYTDQLCHTVNGHVIAPFNGGNYIFHQIQALTDAEIINQIERVHIPTRYVITSPTTRKIQIWLIDWSMLYMGHWNKYLELYDTDAAVPRAVFERHW